jgi:LDH2 family malate/lactate/ureidoglycolate dehydrogenase
MDEHIVDWILLRAHCQKIIMRLGLSEEDAFVLADCMVFADLSGVESHGVSRMGIYTKRLETGVVNKNFSVNVEKEYPASIVLNGCNSSGMLVGKFAMEKCVAKARESGSCFAVANNSNHYGMATYYATIAARAGMVGISGTNAPPNIAPWGSCKKYFGTNPIAISVPSDTEPIVLDMAPCVAAMGKVALAAKKRIPIPEGWAFDEKGNSTTDPNEALKGSAAPIGGPKGYGIALFVDILSGILSGAQFGPYLNHMYNDFQNPQNLGHFFHAIDISKFTDLDLFKKRIGKMVTDVKNLPKKEGISELFLPGEIECRRREERKKSGIPLSAFVYNELKDISAKYNVDFPF